MKIAVLGDGAWGSALACLLNENGHSVSIWGPFPDYMDEMRKSRANPRFFPEIRFKESLRLVSDIGEAVDGAELLLLALPSQYIRGLLEKIVPFFNPDKHILLNVAKGIENDTLKRVDEIVEEVVGEANYAVLSGPSHAEEVYRKVPTAVAVASKNISVGEEVQKAFINNYFRVYYTADIIGVELGGALKNVLAIAAGVVDGMKLGDNAKAALLTRGIAEISRFGKTFGGLPETFSGLSGLGDLIVTCYSGYSRNRFVGEKLGKGMKLKEILSELGMVVAEGVKTTKSAYEAAKRNNIETPIINELYAGLYLGKDPREIIRDLMSRDPKPEIY